jgi:hypothetical protein
MEHACMHVEPYMGAIEPSARSHTAHPISSAVHHSCRKIHLIDMARGRTAVEAHMERTWWGRGGERGARGDGEP